MNQNVRDLVIAVEEAIDLLFQDYGRLATDDDKFRIIAAVLETLASFEIAEAAK